MKKIFLLILSLVATTVSSLAQQEIEVKSEISEVTIYLSGAQITRTKSVALPAGRSILRFVNLSPFIDNKSISINAKGNLTVLSVNFQQNFLSGQKKSVEMEKLLKNKEEIERKIKSEGTYLGVLNEELTFLKTNSSIGGANTGISMTALKEAETYFTDKITSIKLKEDERQNNIDKLSMELEKTTNQINQLTSKKELPSGEILVNIDSQAAINADFELKYVVGNAGWTPSYDIRVKNIELPTDLTYKANVHQNTAEDWKNIKLKLSSSDPNTSNSYREMETYYLNYNTVPPSYNNNILYVTGHAYDSENKEPIPGASIVIVGTTIGTVTDANGAYALSVPGRGGSISATSIGFKRAETPINRNVIDFILTPDALALQEVVVTGYGIRKKATENVLQGRVSGLSTVNDYKSPLPGLKAETMVETEQVSNQTSFEFEIKAPYTVPSDGKNLAIEIESYSLPADYRYFCAPKIDKNAYLVARIVDWEKYNLLEGEANVFFEETYTGKTLLDTRYMSDTLSISLGRDKGVTIKREIQKQFTSKQFLGAKKEETKTWLTTIKNNKQQKINITLSDQIPVSTLEEIEVLPLNISGGKLDKESGLIKWEFDLNPALKKEIELKYSVKYPKYRTLIIE